MCNARKFEIWRNDLIGKRFMDKGYILIQD